VAWALAAVADEDAAQQWQEEILTADADEDAVDFKGEIK
jgi:hypothetical protein